MGDLVSEPALTSCVLGTIAYANPVEAASTDRKGLICCAKKVELGRSLLPASVRLRFARSIPGDGKTAGFHAETDPDGRAELALDGGSSHDAVSVYLTQLHFRPESAAQVRAGPLGVVGVLSKVSKSARAWKRGAASTSTLTTTRPATARSGAFLMTEDGAPRDPG